jgi:hypothetical protein
MAAKVVFSCAARAVTINTEESMTARSVVNGTLSLMAANLFSSVSRRTE